MSLWVYIILCQNFRNKPLCLSDVLKCVTEILFIPRRWVFVFSTPPLPYVHIATDINLSLRVKETELFQTPAIGAGANCGGEGEGRSRGRGSSPHHSNHNGSLNPNYRTIADNCPGIIFYSHWITTDHYYSLVSLGYSIKHIYVGTKIRT